MVHSSSFATSAVLQRTPYDAEGSFDAITTLAGAPFFILAHPSFPARTVPELVAEAKRRPGAINYASSGTGGVNHFTTEHFCLAAGIRMTMVPYRGTAAAVTDLVAGHVQVMITSIASANAAIREGRVRVIGATDEDAALPQGVPPVRSVRSAGIDYDFRIWWGLLAPKGLATPLRLRILAEVTEALKDPNLARIYDAEGATPAPQPDGAFPRLLSAELARWRRVKEAANITAD
jgi:tripartite-type tricarboxylate transporter receptor subunit TctC